MEMLFDASSWGTPLGISLFFFFSASGAGILFWGISKLQRSDKQDREEKA